ncbi:hypothetical protein GCK72_020150 [Caenorhabditis remanei]|uniref:Uncharacterized protein n=1 Tax=Caenorhabditis remanei TaxID=31234 RepID=A0A6A5GFZ5_CAERE|nr:hypothetical protein GCK72_020150 [Caenorhabditis remanei]KAF1753593.1 hypothetical protein GCK72_020150 [Caenorhabditis remanei]
MSSSSSKMTLFYMLTNSFELWPDAYECSENTKYPETRWPKFGIYLISCGSVLIVLYSLCFIAILKVKKLTPAYQLMLILSVFDITSLSLGSVITGFLTYHGIFFCQYPRFFYISGCIAMFTWLTNCVTCIILAIERCAEVNPRFFLYFLFERRVFKLVLLFIAVYGVNSLMFSKPVIFSPEYSTFVFDPMIGKDPTLYTNSWLAVNNLMIAVSSTTLYFYLCYYLIFKFGYSTSMWLYKSKRQIVMQGVIMCLFHSAAACVYEYMTYFPSPLYLIVTGQTLWQLASGCLSVVYLTLNRTIRNSVVKMVIPKAIRKKFGLHIGVEEHLEIERAADNGGVSSLNAAGFVVKFDNFV